MGAIPSQELRPQSKSPVARVVQSYCNGTTDSSELFT